MPPTKPNRSPEIDAYLDGLRQEREKEAKPGRAAMRLLAFVAGIVVVWVVVLLGAGIVLSAARVAAAVVGWP